MKWFVFLAALLIAPLSVSAQTLPASQLYGQAMDIAATGHDGEAAARLKGGAAMLPDGDVWKERMALASSLLDMRRLQRVEAIGAGTSPNAAMVSAYLKNRPAPQPASNWIVTTLATVLPGAGHAWLGRWHDALTAALLVWPMLGLTLWAAWRRMGPVTVFFAIITLWLWSGSVFSAISLAERGGYEAYMLWWQGVWQASALPGRPW